MTRAILAAIVLTILALPANSLGPQCAGQPGQPLTVADIRAQLDKLQDTDRIAILLDGKVARLATVAESGCWAQGNARLYGLEHCDNGQEPDILAIF